MRVTAHISHTWKWEEKYITHEDLWQYITWDCITSVLLNFDIQSLAQHSSRYIKNKTLYANHSALQLEDRFTLSYKKKSDSDYSWLLLNAHKRHSNQWLIRIIYLTCYHMQNRDFFSVFMGWGVQEHVLVKFLLTW